MKSKKLWNAKLAGVLMLFATAIIAGCVGQEGDVFLSILDVRLVGGGAEDTTITAKVPEFARKDRDFDWQIVVQPSIDIQNVKIEVYDTGLFEPWEGMRGPFEKDLIKANRTEIFSLRYHMGDPGLAEDTDIKFRTFYTSNATISTSVVVLSEVEYFERKARDTLGEIPISTWTSTNPLRVTVTWSDEQPLLDAQEVQMYVDYQNLGTGFIDKLEPGEVYFIVPGNIEFQSCDDYRLEGEILILKRELDFLQKRAKRSTCTFKAKGTGTIDSRSIVGVAAYRYEIDSAVTVPIIGK